MVADAEVDILLHDIKLTQLTPLPDEEYPRLCEERKPDRGFYIALGLVISVWMITPLSCVYLIWYTLLSSQPHSLTATIFAAYALTEAAFAVYLSRLSNLVQQPAPPSNLSDETRTTLIQKVFHSGLRYPTPPRGLLAHEKDDIEDRDAIAERADADYQKGFISAAELYHIRDREYEETVGMRERRRVGKMTQPEQDVISAFVEEEDGDRERRLKEQIAGDVTRPTEEWGYEGIVKEGEIVKLHPWDRRAIEFRERLRTWFNNAPWEKIKKTNIQLWLAWSCYGLPLEDARATDEQANFLDVATRLLEARTGTDFEDGFSEGVEVMRLTLDPVNARGRPLILYAVTNLINMALREVVYPFQGVALYREGDIEYLIRIPHGWTPEKGRTVPNAMPVVYLHGLGFGLLQSHLLIKHLIASLPTHPIMIPISPHTSQSMFNKRHLRPWTRAEHVGFMKTICRKWGFWDGSDTDRKEDVEAGERKRDRIGGVSLLSHSNGSVGHAWILKDCPSLVRRSTFVDPVVFCLWEGDVCHSFCYRKPTNALELLLYYFIASEVGIANYIQRHFDWSENTLFLEEIPFAKDPRKTAFFLGGHDMIIDAARVRKYLERQGVTSGLHWDATAGHGDGLAGVSRDRVVMYVGTGSTSGWQTWLGKGRRRHSLGTNDLLNRGGRRRGE
ncbi:hypothetical protein L198_03060 [Cryptococcus wingfieldii CBS 7118]|uniref:Uncharacterized protein n=1 Tax=Cryptococcus wingfieldii CBS 7118 TaxID=1295528 RepID=A0A1E3JIL9_9TREE|nr:hypothetical protein L198_03060 [Cryptococcus wingfieldii CBS 7118]ODO00734.1 hypothetical protein L198_03060 [Cryptococcus wingfieldii CBS 7118]